MANITTTFVRVIDGAIIEQAGVITITFGTLVGGSGGDVTKAYVDFQDNLKVDKVTGKSLLLDTEIAKLSEYPALTEQTDKFIREDGTLATVPMPIGVIGTNVYASMTPSTLLEGAYQLKRIVDPTETTRTLTSQNNIETFGEKFICEEHLGTDLIPAGAWGFDYYRKISSLVGDNFFKLRIFLFNSETLAEVDLFNLTSPDISDIDYIERAISYSIGAIAIDQLKDHLGCEFSFLSTSTVARTISYIIGDGRGWFMRPPIRADHDGLSNKNGNPDFQHLTAAQVSKVNGDITEIAASGIAETYPLELNKQVSITGTLPNGVNSTFTIPPPTSAKENESVVHFASNATAAPTLVYSGFTPVWGGGKPIAMVASKRYTIVFEQIYNGTAWVVLANWEEY